MSTIQTKFTLGLLTVDPCDPGKDAVEEKSPEVLAVEQAARDAIKAKKKAKKVARQKSKESQSPSGRKRVTRKKSKEPAPSPEELEAKKKAEEESEAAKKKAAEEEEAAKKAAEEEAARKAAEEEAQQMEEPEPSMTEEIEPEPEPEPEPPQPTIERPKLERRISFFPPSGDNTGLNDAIRRYGNDVPFDWEKPEWTKEHVDLRHTSTMNNTYGWELPDWAKNSNLRKTELGEKAKQGATLARPARFGGISNRTAVRRSSSMAERGLIEITSKEIVSALPEWAKGNVLRTTEWGQAAKQGLNLAIPLHIVKALAAGGSEEDLGFDASFASLNPGGGKTIGTDKPEWAINPSLKPSDKGLAVRQGANLALPAVGIREIALGEEGGGNDSREMSPNASFATLNASQKNIGWEKPAWTKVALKKTSKGEQMKETGTLARPIIPRGDD